MAVRRATVSRFEVQLDVVDAGVMASRSSAAYSILRGAFGGGAATTGNDIHEAEEDADVASGGVEGARNRRRTGRRPRTIGGGGG